MEASHQSHHHSGATRGRRKRRHVLKTRSARRWCASAVALTATALVVLALRGPCYSALPDNRLPDALSFDAAAGGDADGAADAFPASASAKWLRAAAHDGPAALLFDVCGGAPDQRLSLAYGLVIAKHLRRPAVLPRLITSGVRNRWREGQEEALDPLTGERHAMAAFETVFDLEPLAAALAAAGAQGLGMQCCAACVCSVQGAGGGAHAAGTP